MKFIGEVRVKAPRDAVFAKLEDLRFFTSCIDGVHELELADADHFKAVLETRIAYIRFKFAITGEIIERVAPSRMVARSEGTPMGVVGRLTATSSADLTEADGTTTIAYAIELALTGKLGSLGQPVLRSKAKELEKQFATNLAAAFEPAGASPAP